MSVRAEQAEDLFEDVSDLAEEEIEEELSSLVKIKNPTDEVRARIKILDDELIDRRVDEGWFDEGLRAGTVA